MVRESMRNAYIINPLRDGTVLMAVAVWYVGSEQPRLLGLRRRVIGNMLAAVFILRLINRWARRQALNLYPDGVLPAEDDPMGHL